LFEGRHLTEADFINIFVGGLKGKIKPFVKIFKSSTLEEAYEYALYMEQTTDSPFKKLKGATRPTLSLPAQSYKLALKKHPNFTSKSVPPDLPAKAARSKYRC
jgi:hypothetical protein